jgi:ATP-dependent DNA helicase RecG
VGPFRADLLKKELGIFTFDDLLNHFPYRHVDRTKINLIREINPDIDYIQVKGKLVSLEILGDKRSRRLVAELRDPSGVLELVWFQGITGIQKLLQTGNEYLVYGRTGYYQGNPQMTHPEIEPYVRPQEGGQQQGEGEQRAESRPQGETRSPGETRPYLEPVYPTTEKLKVKGLGGRQLGKLTFTLLNMLK